MSDRYFLDTNIFIYCFDQREGRKQQKAEAMVAQALRDHRGLISTQVIQEFFNVATRKFINPMRPEECRAYLDTVLGPLCEVFPSFSMYREALSIQAETRYSFYDSLIIAAALESRCQVLYSEDLQEGQTVRGLKITNPFAALPVK